MKTAIAYEPVCVGGVHDAFLAGMLEALVCVYDRIFFLGDPSTIAAVRNLMLADSVAAIHWEPYSVPSPADYTFLHRLPMECRLLRRVVTLAKDNHADAIIGFSFTRPGLAAAKLFSQFMVRRISYGVVAHMVLDTLSTSRRDRWLVRFANSRRFKILVLGESTLSAAVSAFTRTDGLFRAITHPYPMADAPGHGALPMTGPLVFGFPGRASEEKGFPVFLQIAERLHSPEAQFVVVGRVADESPSRERASQLVSSGAVSVLSIGSERVASATFKAELLRVHYLVYPYAAQAYSLVQSGAAMDALWAARPLIAKRIPMFEVLFRQLGDVGYTCASDAEFISTIEYLIANRSATRYEFQSSNLVKGRQLFSPLVVGAGIRNALNAGEAQIQLKNT